MTAGIRALIPNSLVNYGKHLPTAVLANLRFGFPSRDMTVIGVTGTDGKTTTVNMIYQILTEAGQKAAMISTIKAIVDGRTLDTGFHVTNPEPMVLQRYIRQAKQKQTKYLVLEVTSQGLVQFRNWGIKFDIGVITNITRDHLDYHRTWENYFQAKARLIRHVKLAVLNRDEAHFERLAKLAGGQVVSFGLTKQADFNPTKTPVDLKLPGQFNVLNALAAMAVTSSLGLDQTVIANSLAHFDSLDGRMEMIKNNRGLKIYVDFAHTPNGLEQALKALKSETNGHRLIAVFGSASERDVGKRPLMGQAAGRLADLVVLTAEDPRFEEPEQIIDQIAEGVLAVRGSVDGYLYRQPDRQAAIKLAISLAKRGDVIGVFGKGHERSMNYRGQELPWSDKKAIESVLDEEK